MGWRSRADFDSRPSVFRETAAHPVSYGTKREMSLLRWLLSLTPIVNHPNANIESSPGTKSLSRPSSIGRASG